MALPAFFDRVYNAIGGHLAVSRESLEQALRDISVGIQCDEAVSLGDVWIAELTANIAARLYPRLAINADSGLREKLCAIASEINPRVEIVHSAPPETTISIGSRLERDIHVRANGWVASIFHGTSPRDSSHPNPYASGAAAAMACSELFRRIFLRSSNERDTSVSLLDFSSDAGADLDLRAGTVGEVLFVGVGAVGTAAVWALCRDAERNGHLKLIDPEELSLLNLQRYVLGLQKDVGVAKVRLAERAFRDANITVSKHKTTLETYAEKQGGIHSPTICVSVDNVDSRRTAQALLPKLVINGWTGGEALGASWHIFDNHSACLACLYQPRGRGPSATEQAASALGLAPDRAAILWVTRQSLSEDDLRSAAGSLGVPRESLDPWKGKSLADLYTDVVCGAAPIDVLGVGKLEVVPLAHQSVMAGVLMAAELVKRTDERLSAIAQTEPLVTWDDILRPPPSNWRRPRAQERGCICGDEIFQEVYKQKWRSHPSSSS